MLNPTFNGTEKSIIAPKNIGATLPVDLPEDKVVVNEHAALVQRLEEKCSELERAGAEQRAINEELERRIRVMDEAIPHIVWKARPDGFLDFYNARWYEYTGLSVEETKEFGWQPVLHPDDQQRTSDAWTNAVQSGLPYENEYRIKRGSDGEYRWFLSRALPTRNDHGAIIRWIGTSTDVHDRKLSEEALRASDQRFRTIADTIPQLIWTTGADGSEGYCNVRWYEYSGLDRAQTGGWGWKGSIHPAETERIMALWAESLATGVMFDAECRFKRGADGTYRCFLIRGIPVRNSAGDITQWIGTCTDIEEQKRAIETQAARVIAETANRTKSEFLANMSHEIRTPLTAIIGYSDLLLDTDQTPADRSNAADIIRRSSTHLLALINNILDLSKIEAGEMTCEKISCVPQEMISEVSSSMRVHAKEKQLIFDVKIEGPIPESIQTDPTQVKQILINLVGNAIKFTDSGRVSLLVKMADPLDPVHPRLQFEIRDSGIGMSSQQLEKLFRPFTQADTSTTRRFGGTGLGLTISKKLAQALGGDITVESTPGVGSLFVVTIETGSLDGVKYLSDYNEAFKPNQVPFIHNIRMTGRILLAEDNLDNQNLLSHYLVKAGLIVVVAENGRIACDKVFDDGNRGEALRFDLILMDMQMPEMDGYAAAAKLRSQGYQNPIIALTAHAMATDRAKCLEAGCSDYLTKPVNRRTLLELLQRHLAAGTTFKPAVPVVPVASTVRSQIVDDEDNAIGQFLPAYISHLPMQVHRPATLLQQGNMDDLSREVHQLKGTGGLYGFISITDSASRAEELIMQKNSLDSIATEVNTLIHLIRNVATYDPRLEASPAL